MSGLKSFKKKIAVVAFNGGKLSFIDYFDEDELDKALDVKKVLEADGREVLVVSAYVPND